MREGKGLPNLPKARMIARLSQQALSDEVGITRAAISRIEQGHNDPTLKTVFAIMHALAKRGLAVSVEFLSDYPTGRHSDDYLKKGTHPALREESD